MDTNFYVLDTIHALNHKLNAGGQYTNDLSIRCSNCRAFIRADDSPEINIELNYIGRLGFTEYLWNSHSLPIFRDDLINLWQKSKISGFKIKPIHITGWYQKPKKPLPQGIPPYFELIATSNAKLIEPKPLSEPCPKCGFVNYAFPKIGNHLPNGIQIDVDSWQEKDFFSVVGYNFLFCTRNVVELTLKTDYSRAIAFVNIRDWGRWEEFNGSKWNPKSYQAYIEKFLIRKIEDLP